MTDFEIGEVVTPTPDSAAYIKALGGGPGNEFVVIGIDANTLTVRPANSSGRTSWASIHAFSWRFEKVKPKPKRVEGEEIEPEDIRVGDEVVVTIDEGVRKSSRQGIVDRISSCISNVGKEGYLFAAGYLYINWNLEGETFVLVKAAPEVDEVLEKIKDAPNGQVIKFRGLLAHKSMASQNWDVYWTNGVAGYTSEDLRILIGDVKVTFYKEED